MKLFSLRLTTLKSKLYAIVFASFVVRVASVLLLPSTPSRFAPDEGTYARLTENLVNSVEIQQYPYSSFDIVTAPLVLPASLLHSLGVSPLTSVRTISSILGFGSLILVVLMANLVFRTVKISESSVRIKSNLAVSLVAVYAFFPSHFLWSIVGLRESILEFWVIAVFVCIFRLSFFEKKQTRFGFLLLAAILNISIIRQQLMWGIIIIVIASILKISHSFKSIVLIALIIFTGLLGKGIANQNLIGFQISFETKIISSSGNSNEPLSSYCQKVNQIIQTKAGLAKCSIKMHSNIGLDGGTNPIKDIQLIPEIQVGNQEKAASKIYPLNCDVIITAGLGAVLCPIAKYLNSTNTFLFRPYLGFDVTSQSSLMAAIENVFWLGAFLFVFAMCICNRRLAFFGPIAPSLMFFSIYSVGAGAYEGNMGTAFRHKSLILWVVILLLASTIVATQERKAEQQGISGSSQE